MKRPKAYGYIIFALLVIAFGITLHKAGQIAEQLGRITAEKCFGDSK